MEPAETMESNITKKYEKRYLKEMEKLLCKKSLKKGRSVINLFNELIHEDLLTNKLFISMVGKASKNLKVEKCNEELFKCVHTTLGELEKIDDIMEKQTERAQIFLKKFANKNEETQKLFNEISNFSINAMIEYCKEYPERLPMPLKNFLENCQSFYKALFKDFDQKLIVSYQLPSFEEICANQTIDNDMIGKIPQNSHVTEEMQKEIKNLKEEIKSLHSQMGMIQKMFEKMQKSNKFLEEKVSALQQKGKHQLSPKQNNDIHVNHECRRPIVGGKSSNHKNQPQIVSDENNGKINSRINDRKRRRESAEDESSSDDQESCDSDTSDTTSKNNKSPTKKRRCLKENNLKIVEVPNFKVYEKKYGGKIRRRIIVYKDEEKKIGYEYSWNDDKKYFRCLPCEMEHEIIVRANLIKNYDNDEDDYYIELNDVEHQCDPYYLSKDDKKIIKPPKFKIYDAVYIGKTFRRLMVFTNASKKYGYNLSWIEEFKIFRCNDCKNNNKIHVFAKHIQNDGEEYLLLSEQAHQCVPVLASNV